MSDLQTELAKALDTLKGWTDEISNATGESKVDNQLFHVTNNVTRSTFNAVRDNPNKTPQEITDILVNQGFKRNSVTSILSQLKRARLIRSEANDTLVANFPEFTKLSFPRKLTKRKVKAKAKKVTHKAVTPPVQDTVTTKVVIPESKREVSAAVTVEATPVGPTDNLLKKFVDGLTISEARDLLSYLTQVLR